jgi:hypothetical protein
MDESTPMYMSGTYGWSPTQYWLDVNYESGTGTNSDPVYWFLGIAPYWIDGETYYIEARCNDNDDPINWGSDTNYFYGSGVPPT